MNCTYNSVRTTNTTKLIKIIQLFSFILQKCVTTCINKLCVTQNKI